MESAAARVDVHRARFIDEFNLDAPQLLELLEMHTGLNTSAANLSAELDQIACGWLNQNTEAWEKWLPDDAIRWQPLRWWKTWLIVCGVCLFGVWFEPYFDLLYRTCRVPRGRKLETNAHSDVAVADVVVSDVAVSDVARVSFGQRQLHVRKGEHVVELVILRFDTLPEPIDATVSAIDASAVFGEHHSGFSDRSSGGSAIAAQGARSLTFTLRPLERKRLILLHIHGSRHHTGLCRFSAALSVTDHNSIQAIIEPVKLIRLTIIETVSFPNGLLNDLPNKDLLDEASGGSASSFVLPRADRLHRGPRSFSGRLMHAASQLLRGWPKIYSSSENAFQGVIKNTLPVFHYLAEAGRWSLGSGGFPVPDPVKFAVGQICVQGIKGFVEVS